MPLSLPFKDITSGVTRAVQHPGGRAVEDKGRRLPVRWTGTVAGIALLAFGSPVLADDLSGQASIIDGDTLEIHGNGVRLWILEHPSSQLGRCKDSIPYRRGAEAASDIDAFIASQPVNCNPIGLDRSGRTLATMRGWQDRSREA